MLTIEEIETRLQDRNLKRVAESIGVHQNVVYRIARGQKNAQYTTVKKLSDYLQQNP